MEAGKSSVGQDCLLLPAVNLMHLLPENEYMYGLSVLQKAIRQYEEQNGIPASESKEAMPFFRENSRVLIGPETGLFVLPLYESNGSGRSLSQSDSPQITLTWDYERLAEYCISENLFLLKCKYDEEEAVSIFRKQLEVEYDKVFFDAEYTGFTRDSRFFSLLYNACLEVVDPLKSDEKEWRITLFKLLSEADYTYGNGQLIPSAGLHIPKACLKEVNLLDREQQPLLYGTIAGFMKQIGLSPEIYLRGMQD